jgi:hypothetical protein
VSNIPLRINTLGFISTISRTILAIATIGLIDQGVIPDITNGDGGGSGEAHPAEQWGSKPVSYPEYFTVPAKKQYGVSDIVAFAYAAGLVA